MSENKVNVIGAGLAGCEAAWQLAQRGCEVNLYEMKPLKKSPAHSSDNFCELVCSNSFRADGLSNAIGLLKEELRRLGSLIMQCAGQTKVPAGGALAVDREKFSETVTEKIKNHKNIKIINEEILSVDFDINTVIATGPLTSEGLSEDIKRFLGKDYLYFFDAAAPIVSAESIDSQKTYAASRYDKGTPDYINCPMNREEYEIFYKELINAKTVTLKDFEDNRIFEGCMPIEVMAKRGFETMLYGPLKPVGLRDPKTGKIPYAVIQLRKDNAASSLYNIVGFQTHLTFGEQKRVFGLIPGLENAEFVRYGVMHRNLFINSPGLLTNTYETKQKKGLFFAGQMTGVEGYIESVSSGFVAGINAVPNLKNPIIFDKRTAIGALADYISNENIVNFQPMNINFGLIPALEGRYKDKKAETSERSLKIIDEMNV